VSIQSLDFQRWFSPVARTFAFKLAVIWLAWSIVITVAYYRTNIVFLRAESGWYQAISQSPQRHNVIHYFSDSYHGHYTPFIFAAEIELSHWFGPREVAWKWRQLTGFVILATCLSATVYAAAKSSGQAHWNSLALAAGITALFIFQPHILEFVAWPVLIFFLGTIVFSTLALFALLQLARNPTQRKWIWLAAGAAYLSMHCTGLGLMSVLATAAVFAAFLAGIFCGRLKQFSSSGRQLLIALISLVLVAAVHVLCMQFLRTPVSGGPKTAYLDVSMVIGFIAAAFFSASQALVVLRLLPAFHSELVASMWPWGVFLVVAAGSTVVALAWGYLRAPKVERLVQFVLHTFSIIALATYILLGITRAVAEPSETWTLGYLIASRYLVMANFALFGSFTAIAVLLAGKTGRFCIPIFLMLGLTAFATNKQYAKSAYPDLQSALVVSHGKAWREIVSMTRECRAASLPVPDVPMRVLAEFPWPLRYYEPILRSSLKLKADDKIEFVDWKQMDPATQQRYQLASRSLGKVFKTLKVAEN